MATQTSSINQSNSSVANFKLWAKVIDDFFGTAGWTASTDTGQLVWASIATVPTTGNYVYKIWKMADALQGTLPVFVKMEYGNVTTFPSLAITVGTGSDGAGNITGGGTRFVHTLSAATPATATITSYFSGATNRISMMLWESAVDANGPVAIQIERHHDNAGADVGTYVFTAFADPVAVQQQSLRVGAVVPIENRLQCMVPVSNSSGAFDSTDWFCPVFPFVGKMDNPIIMGVVKQGDAIEAQTVTVTMYGASHTMVCSTRAAYATSSAAGTAALCIRFE